MDSPSLLSCTDCTSASDSFDHRRLGFTRRRGAAAGAPTAASARGGSCRQGLSCVVQPAAAGGTGAGAGATAGSRRPGLSGDWHHGATTPAAQLTAMDSPSVLICTEATSENVSFKRLNLAVRPVATGGSGDAGAVAAGTGGAGGCRAGLSGDW